MTRYTGVQGASAFLRDPDRSEHTMTKQTFTVTIDGEVIGRRTSQSKTYTHALVALAPTAESWERARIAAARSKREKADSLRTKVEGPRVSRPLGYTLHLTGETHELRYKEDAPGWGIRVKRGPDGKGWLYRTLASEAERLDIPVLDTFDQEWVWVDGRKALRAKVDEKAAHLIEEAQGLEGAADAPPADTFVVSWHTRKDLAVKASTTGWPQRLQAVEGREVIVVEVD